MKPHFFILLFLLASLVSPVTLAEIYKWTDENGKVHFSDRAPASAKASNISNQLSNINISTDLSSPEMMLNAKQKEENKRQQAHQEARKRKEDDKALERFCRDAQSRLWQLQGPVVFFDENGKEMKVTEKERQKKEQTLLKEIETKCK